VLPTLIAIEVAGVEANVSVDGKAQRGTGFAPRRKIDGGREAPRDGQVACLSSEPLGKRGRNGCNAGGTRAHPLLDPLCDSADEARWQGREVHRQLTREGGVCDIVDRCDPRCDRGQCGFDVMGDDCVGFEAAHQSTRLNDAPRVERDLAP
jgi:hypothetical protein